MTCHARLTPHPAFDFPAGRPAPIIAAPAPVIALRFKLAEQAVERGLPLMVEIRDWQNGELLAKETLRAAWDWLIDRGYRWRPGAAGVWDAP